MQTQAESVILNTTRDGTLICPNCRRKIPAVQVKPDSVLANVVVTCRGCKERFEVNIVKGQAQCLKGQRQ